MHAARERGTEERPNWQSKSCAKSVSHARHRNDGPPHARKSGGYGRVTWSRLAVVARQFRMHLGQPLLVAVVVVVCA